MLFIISLYNYVLYLLDHVIMLFNDYFFVIVNIYEGIKYLQISKLDKGMSDKSHEQNVVG